MKGTDRRGRRESVYRSPAKAAEIWSGPIQRLAWGGQGLAQGPDGRLLLLSAPLALFPGEQVEAEVRWKSGHGEGVVRRWITRDPRRVDPFCPAAMECGGCSLQGAEESRPELKWDMVRDLLRRQLPGAPPARWYPAPGDTRRHRVQLHWDGRALGYHGVRSHRLVPVQACPAASDPLSRAIPRLAEALEARVLPPRPQRWELATGTPSGEVAATAEDGRSWALAPDGWQPGAPPLWHRHRGVALGHAPGGFFQACAPWAMEAFAEVLEGWDLRGARLYDLFGGVGLFSALLGTRFHQRVLVESEPSAVEWAAENLWSLGLEADIHLADVARWLPENLGAPGDLVLLDPPRAGLGPELCGRLRTAGALDLVLVGCDGAAFCRDARDLAPSWRLEALAVLDLFPWTPHAEFVGRFRRA
ncbi:MAG: class I SAM-dependent RNA methyltransferase [Acidobacteria bacterium]|nr:class I SAM-dependent RNA methyltransferase [Acidobacteriota bacterium]